MPPDRQTDRQLRVRLGKQTSGRKHLQMSTPGRASQSMAENRKDGMKVSPVCWQELLIHI